ncbi:MAG: DUF4355 domain-containing protein [Lachnospiraceae bacterium]|nr:DUF4355 domain-containing protein [Lachnospiraceae bacterium]
MKTREVKDLLKDPFFYAPLIFAEGDGDGGDDDGGDNDDDDSDGDDDNGDEKKYTQAEVNKMIEARLARERAKSKAHEDEAEKLARMSESQKQAKALKDLQDRLDQMEAKEARSKMAATARRMLQDESIMVDDVIIDALVKGTAEDTDIAVKAFVKSYKAALKKEAKETFKKPEPKTGGGGTMTRADILKIADRAERQKAIKAHPELFR